MRRLHNLAADARWLEALLDRHARAPETLAPDWRAALDLVEAFFPHALEERGPAVCEPAAEPADRYAHLVASLDPLGLPLPARWEALAREVRALRPQAAGEALGALAVETGHLDSPMRVDWVRARAARSEPPSPAIRRRALEQLVRGETFEAFMARRYPGRKRFGAEGSETVHVLVGRILDRAAEAGVEEVVVAPMHRGRLGLMGCLFGQPLATLFARMEGAHPLADRSRAGDVPYHMGSAGTWRAPAGEVTVRVLPNPSHLEAVNAVALGYARRRQETRGGSGKVLPLILHTDASIVAQGVVAEGLQLAGVAGHDVGGAVHLVFDNQVGFTTDPQEARTSRWCTGPFKAVDSLIAHVNGDDPDAVIAAADLAFDYRAAFAGESVVDLLCVRANGHNELDEPRFTQPAYAAAAAGRRPISERYTATLAEAGVVASEHRASTARDWLTTLEAAAVGGSPETEAAFAPTPAAVRATAPLETIVALAARVPYGEVHPKAARLVAQRAAEWEADAVSWATAEVLALGAALSQGRDVRLAGQDAERGAFLQRHLALVEANGSRRRVFESAPPGWGRLTVLNTPLTEYAALGFAYGYAVAAPEALTIWEAQFGDFANVAQPVFDQLLSCGEEKWGQRCNLVVFLLHGLEGQGPKHSSARIERMLQLCAKDNMRLAHPSTPANHFHLLRSQADEARPLVVFTPKTLLRLKAAVSPRAAFAEGEGWRPVIAGGAARGADRVVMCSGKIAYEVEAALSPRAAGSIAVLRLEQLYPMPEAALAEALRAHPGSELVWLQEEPENFGAGAWLKPRLERLAGAPVRIVARPESPSPAGGFHADHAAGQARLVAEAVATSPASLRGAA